VRPVRPGVREGVAIKRVKRLFLLNSRLGLFTAAPSGFHCTQSPYWSTPSSEVTGLICLVPSPKFSRAPEDFLLVYLCRFAVRSSNNSLEAISWRPASASWLTEVAFPIPLRPGGVDLPAPGYGSRQPHPSGCRQLAFRVTPSGLYRYSMVQEFLPAFLQLRLAASPEGPTHPGMINIAQETLDLRRTGFSPVLSLLIAAYSLLCAPAALVARPSQHRECSPTDRILRGESLSLSFGVRLEPRYIFGAKSLDR